MRTNNRNFLLVAVALAGTPIGLLDEAGAQQAYPAKAITILVPAAAGGPTDTVARLIGEMLQRDTGHLPRQVQVIPLEDGTGYAFVATYEGPA